MKVPVPSPTSNNISSTQTNLCYEPTSVLDLRRSPSPVGGKPPATTVLPAETIDQWDDHVLDNLGWESIMQELDFNEDYTIPASRALIDPNQNSSVITAEYFLPLPPPTDHPLAIHSDSYLNDASFLNPALQVNCLPGIDSYQNNNRDVINGFDHHHSHVVIQELLRAADCFDTNELQLAHVILGRLNHRIPSPPVNGKPLLRAVFFFKEALQSLLNDSTTTNTTGSLTAKFSSWSEIVQTIRAYEAFATVSPIPMFTHFTTNQAILDSVANDNNRCNNKNNHPGTFIHVVDFDIGLGCQYASLMRELIEKPNHSCKLLRVTAVVTEDYAVETKLIRDSLTYFANELKLGFQVEFVLSRTFDMLSFKAINFMEGEKTIVLFSPALFRRLGSTSHFNAFVADLRLVSPQVVVFVDNEGWGQSGVASFRRNLVNAFEFYVMMFESLDHCCSGGEWGRRIEMLLMNPRIAAAVEGCGRRVVAPPWRESLCASGFRQVQLSQFADFQAKCLLGKVQASGFYVAKRHGELLLCWNDHPLVATSAWKC